MPKQRVVSSSDKTQSWRANARSQSKSPIGCAVPSTLTPPKWSLEWPESGGGGPISARSRLDPVDVDQVKNVGRLRERVVLVVSQFLHKARAQDLLPEVAYLAADEGDAYSQLSVETHLVACSLSHLAGEGAH